MTAAKPERVSAGSFLEEEVRRMGAGFRTREIFAYVRGEIMTARRFGLITKDEFDRLDRAMRKDRMTHWNEYEAAEKGGNDDTRAEDHA